MFKGLDFFEKELLGLLEFFDGFFVLLGFGGGLGGGRRIEFDERETRGGWKGWWLEEGWSWGFLEGFVDFDSW